MQKYIRYTIFKTRWGYFGLAGSEFGLLRTCLPLSKTEKVKFELIKNRPVANRDSSIEHRGSTIEFDKKLFSMLQEQIIAYFEGAAINFDSSIPVILDGFSLFTQRILTTCRNIKYGGIISYSGLAKRAGRPKAARAVGSALAKNPLPLIIPCHRVVRNDGKIGGFSALGGATLKKSLLELERQSSKR